VCTTNPDGTANAGVFIFACVKNEDKYYIQMGLAENQTKQNLLRTGEALAVYAANPSTEEGANRGGFPFRPPERAGRGRTAIQRVSYCKSPFSG